MLTPALVPQHVPLAEAARIARRHGFVLRAVEHEGQMRIAMVRPEAAAGRAERGAGAAEAVAGTTGDGDAGTTAAANSTSDSDAAAARVHAPGRLPGRE